MTTRVEGWLQARFAYPARLARLRRAGSEMTTEVCRQQNSLLAHVSDWPNEQVTAQRNRYWPIDHDYRWFSCSRKWLC
jgi:hypothetical protein